MAKQTIGIGSAANDGTGDTLRAAFDICNDNFTELYDGSGGLLHKIEGTNFTGSLLVGHSTTGTLSSAENNTGVGISALDALTTGDSNVAVGNLAGSAITEGASNILIGRATGDALTTGSDNVAIGHFALSTEDAHGKNVAIGYQTLFAQNAGADAYNVAIGYQAGLSVSTGIYNTILGGEAGDALTTGSYNVAIGYRALTSEDTLDGNIAIGYKALAVQDGGSSNTVIGYQAGDAVSTGDNNTILGSAAGSDLTTGSNNTIIGRLAAASAVDVSNEITLGNSSISNVRIPSDSTLKIGASGDLQLEHLSSNSFIKNTAVGDLYIENQVDDGDVIFRSDDGSGGVETYFYLDGGGGGSQPFTVWPDSAVAVFGNGHDFRFEHNGTLSKIDNYTGDLEITNYTDDGDLSLRCDDGSGGSATYMFLDGGNTRVQFNKDARFVDDKKVMLGTGDDLQIYHDGTGSYIEQKTGHMYIMQRADDKDIYFQADDGSGGDATYFYLDGGGTLTRFSKRLRMDDSINLQVGSAGDMSIYHNGTDTFIDNATGHLNIRNQQDDGDIVFTADDGSGGNTEYFRLDGGSENVLFSKNARFIDSALLELGTSGDLQIFHNSTDSFIDNYTGNLTIRNRTDDGDIVFTCDDGSGGLTEYFRVDGGATKVIASKNFAFLDNIKAEFGDSGDLSIYHDGTDSFIANTNGVLTVSNTGGAYIVDAGGDINLDAGGNDIVLKGSGSEFGRLTNSSQDFIIKNTNADKDIIFQCDDGSGGTETYFFLDGSAGGSLPFTVFPDSSTLTFGTGYDLRQYHNGTDSYLDNYEGNLNIRNYADDKDIVFSSDDGSGGLAEYFRVDGSSEINIFSKSVRLNDSVELQIGAGQDLKIYHNGTNNLIDSVAGDISIRQLADDKDIRLRCDDGSGGETDYILLDGSEVSTKILTQKVIMSNLPTSDPSNAGQLYTDSGVLKVSAG